MNVGSNILAAQLIADAELRKQGKPARFYPNEAERAELARIKWEEDLIKAARKAQFARDVAKYKAWKDAQKAGKAAARAAEGGDGGFAGLFDSLKKLFTKAHGGSLE